MKSTTINIGVPIDLQRLLETRALIQASSGGGKSYAIRKIAEEVSPLVQTIILDLEGDFITLREKFNFALVSNDGGDIPLNVKYAETLARKLMETSLNAI
jgi:DNA helicase HerA-like ATPase